MIHRPFGQHTGWNASAVGLGTWNLGNQWGDISDRESDAIIRAAIESGMNVIDTAESYGIPNGLSELRIGRVLPDYERESLFIVSKIGHWGKRTGQEVPKTSADMIRVCGHAIAGRMKTAYVDCILCHDGGIADPSVYIEGFEELIGDGMLRSYGISTNNLEVLKRFQEQSNGKCSVVELEVSLLNREAEDGLIDYCREQGMGILVRGPLNKGILSGRYDSDTVFTDSVRRSFNAGGDRRDYYLQQLEKLQQIRDAIGDADLVETSLRYLITHPADMVVIPGATRPEQAKKNAAAGAEKLEQELYKRLCAL